MGSWKETTEESKNRWETNADFWDERMGEHSNRFHREVIRPDTEKLLNIKEGDRVLDIACGNGNFSKRLVELGATVTAFDYSSKMIENAKKRCSYVNQPVPQLYFHRPLNQLFGICFGAGFVINGIAEPVFSKEDTARAFDWYELPPVIIVRLLKQ